MMEWPPLIVIFGLRQGATFGLAGHQLRTMACVFSFSHSLVRVSRILVLSWLIFMVAGRPPEARAQNGKKNEAMLHVVRSFYAWYVSAASGAKGGGVDFVLKKRASSLTDELFRALKQDSDAQAKAGDEIVGLDFDPFLNTQDPCQRYEVGTATRKGKSYWVEIYGICNGRRRDKPDIIAELVPKGGSWAFANFLYPADRSDLLSVLKSLRNQRKN